jgi:hypothetical protein
MRRIKADALVQCQPRHVVLHQPTRPLHPLSISPFSTILPILAHPTVHTLLVSPLPVSESIRITTSPRTATLSSWLTVHPRGVDLASTIDPPKTIRPTRPGHTLGFPKLLAGLQYSETQTRGCGHVVLAGDSGWGARYQGGRSGNGQGVEGGAGVSWRGRGRGRGRRAG